MSTFSAPTSGLLTMTDDFNADGNADIAVSSGSIQAEYVAFGTGTGSLGGFTGYSTGISPADAFGIASGDLQGSSASDLVVTHFSSGSFRILANGGTGTFQARLHGLITGNAEQPVVADINGDGFNDVVVGRCTVAVEVSALPI